MTIFIYKSQMQYSLETKDLLIEGHFLQPADLV